MSRTLLKQPLCQIGRIIELISHNLKIQELSVRFKCICCEFELKGEIIDHRKSDQSIYGGSSRRPRQCRQKTAATVVGRGLGTQKRLWDLKPFALYFAVMGCYNYVFLQCL